MILAIFITAQRRLVGCRCGCGCGCGMRVWAGRCTAAPALPKQRVKGRRTASLHSRGKRRWSAPDVAASSLTGRPTTAFSNQKRCRCLLMGCSICAEKGEGGGGLGERPAPAVPKPPHSAWPGPHAAAAHLYALQAFHHPRHPLPQEVVEGVDMGLHRRGGACAAVSKPAMAAQWASSAAGGSPRSLHASCICMQGPRTWTRSSSS